eukprot:1619579-Rhodomonas_salina.1
MTVLTVVTIERLSLHHGGRVTVTGTGTSTSRLRVDGGTAASEKLELDSETAPMTSRVHRP